MLRDANNEDVMTYKVVVNHEEPSSIWPAHHANAPGWRDGGKQGSKSDRLECIKTVWTDATRNLRDVVGDLDPILRGRGNYSRTGNAARSFNPIDAFVWHRPRDFFQTSGRFAMSRRETSSVSRVRKTARTVRTEVLPIPILR